MFEFAWPWMIVLLPVPLVLRLFRARRDNAEVHTGLRHPGLEQLGNAFAAARGKPPMRWLGLLLKLLVWAGLVGAMMRPQWLEPHSEVITHGYDLMLAVDCSRSMEALDFSVEGRPVSRMAVVKGVLGRFIEQRHGDRLGLLVFGDSAFMQSPLTTDTRAVRELLDLAVPRMAGDATAIGDAIALGVKKLKDRPPQARVLILVTDGENTSGLLPPMEAVQLAEHYGVRIYAIGVGSHGEAGDGKVPMLQNGQIELVRMDIDEGLLKVLAERTGGAYFRATDTRALEEITARIDALEKTESETRTQMLPSPLYRWPLAVAMCGLLLIGLITPAGARP
ncbi:MAG: VWA domain-containing protein [Gammaproteobacteria bacterium]|nr:VWA domain-containing protein [Gammaproteobacteria bacterium]MCP5136170.1 VWA domain-containing protein [Gammaproteobacteria bacterium]